MKGLSAEEELSLFPAVEDGNTLVLSGYRGSVAHGTYIPTSDNMGTDDKDVMGVYIAGAQHYLGLEGLWKPRPWQKTLREWDVVCYELRFFVHLLLKGNPNVLSLLWLDNRHYLFARPDGNVLIKKRDVFASRQAYHTFCGYARGQLARMERGNREGYMGEKRKSLVDKFGYDTKNAAHLVRILRMGIEFLTEGRLHVEREDAAELIAIKRGEWSLDRIKAEAARLFDVAEDAYVHSPLPAEPDRAAANKMVTNILYYSVL